MDDLSTTQIMGGERGNLVISEIVSNIREKSQVSIYLLDTFNFQQNKKNNTKKLKVSTMGQMT